MAGCPYPCVYEQHKLNSVRVVKKERDKLERDVENIHKELKVDSGSQM